MKISILKITYQNHVHYIPFVNWLGEWAKSIEGSGHFIEGGIGGFKVFSDVNKAYKTMENRLYMIAKKGGINEKLETEINNQYRSIDIDNIILWLKNKNRTTPDPEEILGLHTLITSFMMSGKGLWRGGFGFDYDKELLEVGEIITHNFIINSYLDEDLKSPSFEEKFEKDIIPRKEIFLIMERSSFKKQVEILVDFFMKNIDIEK